MNFFDVIDEQLAFNFRGRINIVSPSTNQLLGRIILLNGKIWSVKYLEQYGMKSLLNLFIDSLSENEKIKTVVEPEVIENIDCDIPFPYSIAKKKIIESYEDYMNCLKQKPPQDVKLTVNGGVISVKSDLNQDEFDILCTLSDHCLVKEIYHESELMDHEITRALVSLRKKGLIKVVGRI